VGTSVEVCELFARVPARRRFLRQAQTEWLQVLALVRRLAFCNPLVQFNLAHDGTRALMVPAVLDDASHARRLKALFGNEFARAAQRVELATPTVRVFGFVAGPALARSQSDLQLLAVNGRVIRDRQLAHAVRLAYDERLPAGRHPSYALQIEMLPEEVDVNVHPGKLEVRFRDLREIHDLLHSATRQGLGDAPSPSAPTVDVGYQSKLPGLPPASRALAPLARDAGAPARPATSAPAAGSEWTSVLAERYAVLLATDALTVVDLQAFARRVMEVRLGMAPAGAVPTRPLLVPVRIECRDEASRQPVETTLRELGLAVHPLGPRTLALRSLPRVAPEIDAARLGPALAERGSLATVCWLAGALAGALVVPAGLVERRQWWLHWQAQAVEAGVTPGDFTLRLDPPRLAQLMGPGK
jgi:DNA mismatch repair protein MutL